MILNNEVLHNIATTMAQVSDVIKNIEAAANGSLGDLKDTDRARLLDACNGLRMAIESPLEAIQRITLSVRQ